MDINRFIDHSVLKPEMTLAETQAAIELGLRYDVKTVCVRPMDIELAKALCAGSNTGVITVLAFPHGDTTSAVKAFEAQSYIQAGVDEIDMVANYSLIRSEEWAAVEEDIKAVTKVAKPENVAVKVIFETSQLNMEQIQRTTMAAISAGADFVKTSTGFYGDGASFEIIETMLKAANGRIKVKPSGGIRSYETARQFIEMGVHRLGVGYSSVEAICNKGSSDQGGY